MKRGLNLLRRIGAVCGAALLAVTPLTASAETLFPGGNSVQMTDSGMSADGVWTYNDYGNGTVSVTCSDKSIVHAEVPEAINGRTITMIELDCFKDMTELESVTLPNTITYIEDWAFQNCTSLKTLRLPDGLERIDWQAFYGCSALEQINIPASVTKIEEFVFEGCTSLQAVDVSDANDHYTDVDGVLFDIEKTNLIYYPAAKEGATFELPDTCTKLSDWAFIGNPYLETIDLTGITEIGLHAFYHCTALKSIAVPEGITELKEAVFGSCTALTEVTLPSTLDVIGDSCFYSCTSLSEITIPGRVDTIGAYAFFNCPSLSTITINDAVKNIGDYALGYYFDGNAETPVRLPGFTVDTDNDTAAHEYCVVNDIKSTGGVTQSSVFLTVLIVIVVLVIAATIAIIIIQKKIQKRYELR